MCYLRDNDTLETKYTPKETSARVIDLLLWADEESIAEIERLL